MAAQVALRVPKPIFLILKLQNRRGSPAIYDLEAAPVLEYAFGELICGIPAFDLAIKRPRPNPLP
jgi:hypothetical protein